jgi:hypothetical protein
MESWAVPPTNVLDQQCGALGSLLIRSDLTGASFDEEARSAHAGKNK